MDAALTTRDGAHALRLNYFRGDITEVAEVDPYGRVATVACPNCGDGCWREEVDVEVGIVYGPWGCPCGWSESDEYNQLPGPTSTGGHRTDQWGWLYPTDPASAGARDSR